jgi:anaerobic C4-dicarboxylate transporter
LIRNNAAYALVIVLAAIVAVALLGVWNRVAGKSESASQTGMRIRVVLQFVIICAAMAMLYLSAR